MASKLRDRPADADDAIGMSRCDPFEPMAPAPRVGNADAVDDPPYASAPRREGAYDIGVE